MGRRAVRTQRLQPTAKPDDKADCRASHVTGRSRYTSVFDYDVEVDTGVLDLHESMSLIAESMGKRWSTPLPVLSNSPSTLPPISTSPLSLEDQLAWLPGSGDRLPRVGRSDHHSAACLSSPGWGATLRHNGGRGRLCWVRGQVLVMEVLLCPRAEFGGNLPPD